ncbi:hypothetical protein L1049_027232 [Liquidambar formosana]|uniref:MULE transposase domain-containing protein n=1 Tax=Liquidambar formosana TaxID=63359 RepID=A0AAP0N7Z2_LIQFO
MDAYSFPIDKSYVQGLVGTFDELLLGANHQYCVRHMHANFKGQYRERIFKDEMWMATTSYIVHGFEQYIEKFRSWTRVHIIG